jgi:hypothetical protein
MLKAQNSLQLNRDNRDTGNVVDNRAEGTCNMISRQVRAFTALGKPPGSKDWH